MEQTATERKKRALSCIQPTGAPTLGNYLGALRNWVQMQDEFECAFAVADLHALTVRQDVNVTTSATIDYMAAAPGTGKLIARGRVRHAGGRLCYCATEITDETGKLIAELNSVMYYTSKPLIL